MTTYIRLPEGFDLSDVYVLNKHRSYVHLTHECASFQVNEDGEFQPSAYCDVCDADTLRSADGACSPCDSREPNMDGVEDRVA